MRFGVTIPNNWGIADPGQVLAMGPLAESLGYDSVWVMVVLALNSGEMARITALMVEIAQKVVPEFRPAPRA